MLLSLHWQDLLMHLSPNRCPGIFFGAGMHPHGILIAAMEGEMLLYTQRIGHQTMTYDELV